MDIVTREQRSRMMSGIRGKNTGPELAVRKAAHALGYRFRLHRKDLPGSPDLVFPRKNTVVFVHGCYWHRHEGCRYCYTPKSNIEFWATKFKNNIARDKRVREELEHLGWRVVTLWECETTDVDDLRIRLKEVFRP
ncbi:DNA mismatch endonuclease Vsr [Rhizobium ruizarguesonis]|uniref:very short patch repair endonuclease n=1 Tax=Rhizobium ruizarguesonis TaxID=2081791 RepID=UPI00103243D1|nr:very short patch repair endonuclease [Rhizobium ruizarguesonis]TAT76903.1 DNA mismatch endonuclease Vsr [Rhizobium ruizarguesonis]TAZ33153.1 DNA mismatch endonuclease Vsr [Rhizobium ruizarguesonis]TBC07811.1 DNA mismatch endonuclease Vsr [Rhizobium ruizarguesonis]